MKGMCYIKFSKRETKKHRSIFHFQDEKKPISLYFNSFPTLFLLKCLVLWYLYYVLRYKWIAETFWQFGKNEFYRTTVIALFTSKSLRHSIFLLSLFLYFFPLLYLWPDSWKFFKKSCFMIMLHICRTCLWRG